MTAPSDAELRALVATLATKLETAGRQLVTAESCSGGWIAKACTDLPGSSRWFRGGVVTYSNTAKSAVLGVDPAAIAAHGAVSEPVVRAMALGALQRLGGDVSVAVTGIAGPDGGSLEKPVGTVWFAWASRGPNDAFHVATACERLPGDRDSVRRWAVRRALAGLLDG
jgi:nicotinamide-nucleotide amidase